MKNLFNSLIFLFAGSVSAQPSIQWQTTLGGTSYDEAGTLTQTINGGYIMVGTSNSDDGDVEANYGFSDFWVTRIDSNGAVIWKKNYGGSGEDWAFAVQQTSDGGYVVAGVTDSNDGDVLGNHGGYDAWILKLNSIGNVMWQKCLGGSGWEEAWDIQLTPDGGYVIAGRSSSTDGDVTGNYGSLDYWVVKLSPTAEIEWQKSLGGTDIDLCYSVNPTSDGGYIVAGESQSTDNDVTGNHGGLDAWVVKLNFEGKIEWQRALGGTGLDRANEITQTREGGYIIIGHTDSNNGDVTGNHGGYDFWVVKLNDVGEIEWQKALGGGSDDTGQSIHQTNDGSFVLTGYVKSNNGDVAGNHGGSDVWVVKLTESGDIQWKKAYGGTLAERGYLIHQTSDSGYILAGDAWSTNGDLTGIGNQGHTDFWVVKLSPESSPTSSPHTLPLEIFPNPASLSITLQIPWEEPTLNVSITDLLGRQLSRQTISNGTFGSGEVNVSTLPDGLYLVSATGPSGKMYVGKLRKGE